MSTFHLLCICYTIFLILASCSHAKPSSSYSCPRARPIRAAYYPSSSWDTFAPSSIDTRFFTHILYAFLNPNNVTFQFNIDQTEAPLLSNFTSTLRQKRPPVKTLFSIGGGGGDEVTKVLSHMASNKSSRAAFITSSIYVAKTYKFDGFDLDWEFPTSVKEMENLALLLEEWREAAGEQFIITAAVYYSADTFLDGNQRRTYPVDSIRKNVDWLNVMNYDYHGSWDTSSTGAHAALYDSKTNLSTNFGIGRWIQAGVPRCKLVMGIPMYGRTWKLNNTKSHGIGAPAVGEGPGEDATMTYAEIVKFNKENNVTGVFDPDTVSVYSYTEANNSWIGYDDPRSVAMKVSFCEALELGGYMIWEVTGDYRWTISKRASDLILLLNQTSDAHSNTR